MEVAVVCSAADDADDADVADVASSVADDAPDVDEVPALWSWIFMDELMTRREDMALRMPSRVVLGHIFCYWHWCFLFRREERTKDQNKCQMRKGRRRCRLQLRYYVELRSCPICAPAVQADIYIFQLISQHIHQSQQPSSLQTTTRGTNPTQPNQVVQSNPAKNQAGSSYLFTAVV